MGFLEVLTRSSFTLIEIWDRIQAKPINSQVEPEVQSASDFLMHLRIVIIKIGLVSVKPMPIIGMSDGVPTPVGRLKIAKNDARLAVFFGIVRPDVEIAPRRSLGSPTRLLKPGVLVGGVVYH